MSATILIRFRAAPGEEPGVLIHRLRNFGEDVFRQLRESEWGKVDIDEIDCATEEFTVTHIKQANKLRLMRWLAEEAARQHLAVTLEERQSQPG